MSTEKNICLFWWTFGLIMMIVKSESVETIYENKKPACDIWPEAYGFLIYYLAALHLPVKL